MLRRKRLDGWLILTGMLRKAFTLLKRALNRFVNPDLSTLRDDPVSRATLGFVRSPYTQMSMYMHGRTTGGLVIPFVFGDGYHSKEEIQAILRESKETKQKKARRALQTEQSP